ncbi:hypothetical protein ACIBU0_35850 [Streptomyces sp. NPDC049627]|uniref:hypothetical protein n=1 Tax=Streptomyces sp. NPDC049627 TaxID=3365595 RepID=UPI0037A798F6
MIVRTITSRAARTALTAAALVHLGFVAFVTGHVAYWKKSWIQCGPFSTSASGARITTPAYPTSDSASRAFRVCAQVTSASPPERHHLHALVVVPQRAAYQARVPGL